jgi:hypothetical protein
MFVTVLSVPVNLKHRNSTALHNITFPLPLTGLTCCRSTYSAVSLTTVSLCPQQTDTKSKEMCRTAVVTYQCLFFLHVSTAQVTSNWHFPSHSLDRCALLRDSVWRLLLGMLHSFVMLSFAISAGSNIWTHTATGLFYWWQRKFCFYVYLSLWVWTVLHSREKVDNYVLAL